MADSKPFVESDTTHAESARNPPAYETFQEKLRSAKADAAGPYDFLKKSSSTMCNSVGFIIAVSIVSALPIAMLVVGALNLKNCPLSHFIPIWLVVTGSLGVFNLVVFIGRSIKARVSDGNDDEPNLPFTFFRTFLQLFSAAWFIAGNVWIFSNYAPNTSEVSAPDYCDKLTYYLAFWIINSCYILLIFSCCCIGIPLAVCFCITSE